MPRSARLIPQEAAMHVMNRGNNCQHLFASDEDKFRYYFLLKEFKQENSIRVFHYCLMNNHVHLIVYLNSSSNLPKYMKQVNLSYFNYFKNKYGYSGHLWQGRFKSNIIDTDAYLLQCGKYIELNPVRAGMVSLPEAYRFSSYRFYAYGREDRLLTDSPAYRGLSDSIEARRKQYLEFVVDGGIINSQKLAKQLFIGNQTFVERMQAHYHVRNCSLKCGRPGLLKK